MPTIMDEIINFFWTFLEMSFTEYNYPVEYVTKIDIIIVLFWSIILSWTVAITYRGTHRGVSYSQSFTQTLILLGVTVGTVMIIVGSDIARAFTLVGALSIVRFRNAIKDTRDVGFIFFTMVIGMACGTRFFLIAIIFTIVCCSLLWYMTYTDFGKKNLTQDILELDIASEVDYTKDLIPLFVKNLKYYSLLSVDSIDSKTNKVTFIVMFKRLSKKYLKIFPVHIKIQDKFGVEESTKMVILMEIQKLTYISNIKIIDGRNMTEI